MFLKDLNKFNSDLLDGKHASNTANNVPVLDSSAKLPIAQIPTGTTSSTVSLGNHTHSNVATANTLATARTINGTSFNGSANITTANWGTARDITIGATKKSVNGAGNVSWSLNEIGVAKGKTASATTGATAGWYRIATTVAGINRNLGTFVVEATVSGKHSVTKIVAGTCYGQNPTIQQLSHTAHSATGLSKARIVYHTTYDGNYAYLEVYLPSATATSINVHMSDYFGWSLVAPNTAGSIPSGYSNKEITFVAGNIVSNVTGSLSGNASTSTKATQDSAGQQINTTYIKGLSVSGKTITYTKGDGSTGTITTQDTNTTYSTGTSSTLGLTKLYTGTGTATDGTMTQNAIKSALDGKANSSHTHNSIVSRGNVTAEGGTTRPAVNGISMSQAYNNNYPTAYGNVLNLKGTGDGQILVGWSGTSGAHAPVYVRSKRDNADANWSDWAQIYTTANKPTPADIGASASSHTHNYAGSSSVGGSANTAVKLHTARTINGTSFDGSGNITTSQWGTARNISVSDSDGTNTGSAVSVNGSANVTLKLPATIKASLNGNASTATKAVQLTTARKIGRADFNGTANIELGAIAGRATISSSADTNANKFSKFARIDVSGGTYRNCSGTLEFIPTEGSSFTGELYYYFRTGSAITSTSIVLDWKTISNTSYTASVVAVKVSDGVYDLYYKPIGTWDTMSVTNVNSTGTSYMTLYSSQGYVDSVTAVATSRLNNVASSVTGNAGTATTLQNTRTINGTNFNGSANITTANWGTARNITISDSDGTNTGSAVSVNGSGNATLKLPTTIKATLSGNASTATKATQDSAGQQINTTYIKGLSVSGKTITYTKGDGSTGTITTQDTNTTYSVGTASALGLTKLYTGTGTATDGTMTQNAINSALNGKANTSHTHSSLTGATGSTIAPTTGTGIMRYDYNVSSANAGTLPVSNNANGVLTLNTHSGNYYNQLGFSSNGNLYYRAFNGTALDTTTSWKQVAFTNSSISGNAGTATKLQTARTINGTSFDGSANITTSNWGTARKINNISVNGSADVKLPLDYYTCSVANDNTNLYHHILASGQCTGDYSDKSITVLLVNHYNSSGFGIAKITLRTNQASNGATANGEIQWLVRSGFSANQLCFNIRNTAKDTYMDVFYKSSGSYNSLTWYVLSEGGRGNHSSQWTKNNTNASGTNAYTEANMKALRSYTSTLVSAQETGVVNYSNSAGTLSTARTINGTSFNGSANITTANWGTARNISVSDSDGTNTGSAVSVNGSANATLKLPATIKASLTGNATTATTLATARTINGTSFNGSANITTANWGTARTLTIGNTGKSVNGSGNVSWSLAEIGASPTSHNHGLLHDNFAVEVANTTTDSGWSMINSNYNGYILKSIRSNSSAPAWLQSNYSAGIAFGGSDTKGVMSVAYSSPSVRFAGGNGTKPVWYFTLTGTSGKSYNMDSLATKSEVDELKTLINSAKSGLANAITNKGVSATSSDSFDTLISKVSQIDVGAKFT